MTQRVYIILLILYTVALSMVNFFHGFGEDSDSMRVMLAAREYCTGSNLHASRTWGFPLYEFITYSLLCLPNGMLFAKLASLIYSGITITIIFRLCCSISGSTFTGFMIALIYASNPVIIIASNSILETSMSILMLVIIILFVYKNSFILTQSTNDNVQKYLLYGFLFGIATLIRPDNLFYFPVLYVVLYLSTGTLSIKNSLLSSITAVIVGIGPYYLINYPIFKDIPLNDNSSLLYVIKNVIAIFGIPFLIGFTCIVLFRKSYWQFSRLKLLLRGNGNPLVLYFCVFIFFVFLRMTIMTDELEYGIIGWAVFVLALSYFVRRYHVTKSLFAMMVLLALIPNFFQFSFFRERSFDYYFSMGIADGVFQQEKQRRLYYESVLSKGSQVLNEYANRNLQIQNNVTPSILFKDCNNCIVYTTFRELYHYKKQGWRATEISSNRFVVNPTFNVSRGWRNLIKDDGIQKLEHEYLQLAY